MPTDQEEPVATGLTAQPLPEQKLPTDTAALTAATEAAPVASADVPLVQVAGLGPDVTVKVAEVNQSVQEFDLAVQRQAENDNLKKDFVEQVMALRVPEAVPAPPPPIPPRIAEQTRLEMEAGKARVKEFEAQQASRPRPAPAPDGTMTAVFRPEDYIPDPKKGQGNLASASARTL